MQDLTKNLKVFFSVNAHTLTLYKTSNSLSELSEIEKQIAKKNGGQYEVPLFEYQVKDYGVIANNTDAHGEKTSTLRLQNTPWEQATHIEISLLPKDRRPLDLDNGELKVKEEYFLKDQVNEQVMSAKDLNEILKLNTASSDHTLFYTKISGRDKLVIFEVVKSKQLSKVSIGVAANKTLAMVA